MVQIRVGHKTNNHLIQKDFGMKTPRIQGLGIAVFSLLVLPLALVGCTVGEAGNPPPAAPAPEVTTAEVAVRDLNDWTEIGRAHV